VVPWKGLNDKGSKDDVIYNERVRVAQRCLLDAQGDIPPRLDPKQMVTKQMVIKQMVIKQTVMKQKSFVENETYITSNPAAEPKCINTNTQAQKHTASLKHNDQLLLCWEQSKYHNSKRAHL